MAPSSVWSSEGPRASTSRLRRDRSVAPIKMAPIVAQRERGTGNGVVPDARAISTTAGTMNRLLTRKPGRTDAGSRSRRTRPALCGQSADRRLLRACGVGRGSSSGSQQGLRVAGPRPSRCEPRRCRRRVAGLARVGANRDDLARGLVLPLPRGNRLLGGVVHVMRRDQHPDPCPGGDGFQHVVQSRQCEEGAEPFDGD